MGRKVDNQKVSPRRQDARRFGDHLGRPPLLQTRQCNGELVPTHARNKIAIANRFAETICHRLQKLITHLVTVGVVDELEAVEIDEKERHGYAADATSFVRVTRTGEGLVPARFILGGEEPRAGEPLREELARILTSHPQFAVATVNRIWAEMMGVGIVDPVDDMRASNPASNEKLLAALTKDLVDHKFDIKHLIRRIMLSATYQRSSKANETNGDDEIYYSRYIVRRLPAEVVLVWIVSPFAFVSSKILPG